ncbi:unnamed protein product [Cunninghamella blakesleeana]
MAKETPQLKGLQQITIEPRQTYFWRFQQKSDNHLATIEAIYYIYREYADAYETSSSLEYHGQYDNLMFYYKFFYNLIQDKYRKNHDRTFNRRHKKDYIKYEDGKEPELLLNQKEKQDKSENKKKKLDEENSHSSIENDNENNTNQLDNNDNSNK